MSKLISLLVIAFVAAGCHNNDNFCAGANPDNNCSEKADAAIDGPSLCTGDPQCSGATAVCDVSGSMKCVQCTMADHPACTGTTPTCGSDNSCHRCTMHSQCASTVCLPDGSCGDDSNVAYVDPAGTDNTMCTKAMPCTKVAKALATTRAFVKFHGTTDEGVTVNGARQVSFLADPSAALTRASGGAILTVADDNTALALYDLTINNAPNTASGFGIVVPTASGAPAVSLTRVTVSNNPGGGVSVSGGTLTVSQSTVSGNQGGGVSSSGGTLTITQSSISGNAGGGVSITSSAFDLTNNLITKNGSATTTYGGILFNQLSSGMHKLDFNTIAGNVATTGTTTGVVCSLVTQTATFSNNIVYGNSGSGVGTQVSGNNCSWTYSDIGPDTAAGTGNINMDPMFASPSQNNFHIMSGSPAKDAADPAATLDVDFDGDTRPQGPARDIGADEYKP